MCMKLSSCGWLKKPQKKQTRLLYQKIHVSSVFAFTGSSFRPLMWIPHTHTHTRTHTRTHHTRTHTHTHTSLSSLSWFGYAWWGCRSDYTGIMGWAFKGRVVCFSSSLKDTRGFKGIQRNRVNVEVFIPYLSFRSLIHLTSLTISRY